jgi:prepilin-type N-terminal cleavage/methylation domain-containing protein
MKFLKETRFTLVELLCVVAIITILAYFMLPAFTNLREATRKAAVVSQMKNLHLAVILFAGKHNGYLPHEDNGSGGKPPFGLWWYEVLPGCISDISDKKKASETMCQDQNVRPDEMYSPTNTKCHSFKMNSRLEGYKGSSDCRSIKSAKYPSRTVLFFSARVDTAYYQ